MLGLIVNERQPLFTTCGATSQSTVTPLYDITSVRRAENGQIRFTDVLFFSPRLRREFIDRQPEEP